MLKPKKDTPQKFFSHFAFFSPFLLDKFGPPTPKVQSSHHTTPHLTHTTPHHASLCQPRNQDQKTREIPAKRKKKKRKKVKNHTHLTRRKIHQSSTQLQRRKDYVDITRSYFLCFCTYLRKRMKGMNNDSTVPALPPSLANKKRNLVSEKDPA